MQEIISTKDYISFLDEIKRDIQTSRIKAHLAVNKELVLLYWRIGNEIIKRKAVQGWGSDVISLLSQDLKLAFPDMRGFGVRSLEYMQTLATVFSDLELAQQVVAEIPWGHITSILDKVKDKELKLWYIRKTIENGWSRNVLLLNIKSETHLKIGAAQTNFHTNLPKPQSDLAQELIKSEYNFDFLGLSGDIHEKEIEKGLIDNIKHFLLALGSGFSFLGSQYRVKLAGEEFFIDLLMYHVKLKSYIVLELKSGSFKPEYAGKLSFYLTAIDREIKDENDNPSIGILLCQSSNKLMVEYCLQDLRKPIGVSEYITKKLPKNMEEYLPSPEQFQHIIETSNKNEDDKLDT